MAWDCGKLDLSFLYDAMVERVKTEGEEFMSKSFVQNGGDQKMIEGTYRTTTNGSPGAIQSLVKVQSYKRHLRGMGKHPHPHISFICFHGNPRPIAPDEIDARWVGRIWR